MLLPVLLLATISLNGMSRLAQLGRQSVPVLRSQFSQQPMRLPATMPGGAFPRTACRTFSSSSRAQAGQAAFGGARSALLLGGAGAAALAGKAAYDYFDTPEGRLLKRAHAAESNDTETLAQEGTFAKENEALQFALDLIYKVTWDKNSLSEEEVGKLVDAIPTLLKADFFDDQKFSWGGKETKRSLNNFPYNSFYNPHDVPLYYPDYRSLNSRVTGALFITTLLEKMRNSRAAAYWDGNTTRYVNKNYFLPVSTHNEKIITAVIDKVIDVLGSSEPSWYAIPILEKMFRDSPDLRIGILKKVTSLEENSTNKAYGYLDQFYANLATRINDIVASNEMYVETKDLSDRLAQSRNELPSEVLNLLVEQRKGAGTLLKYLQDGRHGGSSQKTTWVLAKEIMKHPEITPTLAGTYNNPAPEFDSFRDFVDQKIFSYNTGSPEEEALYAIKREAFRQAQGESASGRVQE